MKLVVAALALVFIVATLVPLLRHEVWWIRVFDFPRGQVAVGGLVVAAAYLAFWGRFAAYDYVLLGALVLSVGMQVAQMFPYTALAAKQVKDAAPADVDPDASLALLIANVLMTNREAGAFVELVRRYDPDVILAVETDDWWAEQLQVIEADYPYTVKKPIDNTYGMLLYSRLPLVDPEVRFLLKDDIPSIRTHVRLPGGRTVLLYGLHPEPPYPKEAKTTVERDAELLLVGKEVAERTGPVVVAGDMNDVAWSYTTHLFQKISHLLDPRMGRGMYNTFSAKNPLLRWPLDHVFHSDDFELVELERGPAWGSDHFPVYVRLALTPGAEAEQEDARPQADREEREAAEEKIDEAIQKAPQE